MSPDSLQEDKVYILLRLFCPSQLVPSVANVNVNQGSVVEKEFLATVVAERANFYCLLCTPHYLWRASNEITQFIARNRSFPTYPDQKRASS
jgi:hypothetical protein